MFSLKDFKRNISFSGSSVNGNLHMFGSIVHGLNPLVFVYKVVDILTHGCAKVHGGVPIVLCNFVDPL